MPNYWPLKYFDKSVRTRAINNLELLREQIRMEMPTKTANDTLILGTWNIRNFDDNRFKNGPRLKESLHYIAEVISAFDIVAVQEINEDLGPLKKVIDILGEHYDFILTDVTEGASGNRERLGIIYNRDKVYFQGIAGEIVLPEKHLISKANEGVQFARTPFACSFQSGWFKFNLATVHIYYGSASKSSASFKRRVDEIDAIAEFLSERADEEDYNYILVGDFNIEDFEDQTFNALAKHGFTVFQNKIGSNQEQNKFYDQISFKTRENELNLADTEYSSAILHFFGLLQKDFTVYQKVLEDALSLNIKATEKALEGASARQKKSRLQKQLNGLEEVKHELQGAAADSHQCVAKVFEHLSHNFAAYRDELPLVLKDRLITIKVEWGQAKSQRAKTRLLREAENVDLLLSRLHNRSHGVLNLFQNVFTDEQFEDYKEDVRKTIDEKIQVIEEKMKRTRSEKRKAELQEDINERIAFKSNLKELKEYYLREWRTYQFSDHFPLWVELKIDFSAEYLQKVKQRS